MVVEVVTDNLFIKINFWLFTVKYTDSVQVI